MVYEEFQSNQNLNAPVQEEQTPALTPEQKKAKQRKMMTVITYAIALLCMLVGLFAPLYGPVSGGNIADKMFFKYVPGILNTLLFPFVKKNIITLPENGFFPAGVSSETFSSLALALIIYALVCVIALFMLIPVLVGKKEKRTSVVCAYVFELLAALSSGYYLFAVLSEYAWGTPWVIYNFVIAFGGVMLIMMIQSVYNKGGLGVTKIILMVFSALVFFFLLNINVFIPALGKAFNPLSKALGCGDTATFTSGTAYMAGIYGISFLDILKLGTELALTEKIFYIVGGALTCMCLFNFAYDVFEIVTCSKYNKYGVLAKNKGMSVIAIIRYTLAIVLAAATIIILFVLKDVKPGIFLYIVTLIILIQLIFAIVRAAVLASKHKKAAAADAIVVKPDEAPVFVEPYEFDDAADDVETTTIITPVYEEEHYIYDMHTQQPEAHSQEPAAEAEPVFEEAQEYEQPVVDEQPAVEEEHVVYVEAPVYDEPAEEPVYDYEPEDYDQPEEYEDEPEPEKPDDEEHTYVYNYRPIYNGPTDEFMDTLDDAEKIEFVQVFIERKKGKVNGVPEYVIGHDNSSFFPSVFIHINRAREVASTHLLEKIYKHIGKNN